MGANIWAVLESMREGNDDKMINELQIRLEELQNEKRMELANLKEREANGWREVYNA